MPLFDAYIAGLVLATLLLLRFVRAPQSRPWVLVISSTAFLAYLDAGALVVAITLGALVYIAAPGGRRIGSKWGQRLATGLVVGLLLGVLGYYKYSTLLLGKTQEASTLKLVWVPLGLSFLVFRLIAYYVDQQHPRAQRPSLSCYLLYILFFPTYIAGPLDRWLKFHQEATIPLDASQVAQALQRILYGVAKKVILADQIGMQVLSLGVGPTLPSQGAAWVLAFAYGWRIYIDFSAYSDIAIGLARLFGYEVMENFNSPFLSKNVVEFWRRWHISLSEWIRGYLFMPLATRRPSRLRLHVATVVAMSLCGLWHGAGWNFLLWGAYHGVGISINHLWADFRKKHRWANNIGQWRGAKPLSIAVTYCFVSYGFVFFVRPIPEALMLTKRMFGLI